MTADGTDERFEKLEKALQGVRRRVDEADRGHRDEIAGLRYAVFASVGAGVLLALTATTWRTYRGEAPEIEDVTTLWGIAGERWQGMVTLGLVLVLAIGTIAVFVADTAGRPTHLVFAGIAVLAAAAILFIGLVEPTAWYDAEDTESAPGRWLSLLTAVALAITHAARGSELRR